MGCWAASCVISHLPIYSGDECVLITMEQPAIDWFERNPENVVYETMSHYGREMWEVSTRERYSNLFAKNLTPEELEDLFPTAPWFIPHFGTYNDYGSLEEVDWCPVNEIPHVFVKKEVWDFIQEAHPRLMEKHHWSWKRREERGTAQMTPIHTFFCFVHEQRMSLSFDKMQIMGFQHGEAPEWQLRAEFLTLVGDLNTKLMKEYYEDQEDLDDEDE